MNKLAFFRELRMHLHAFSKNEVDAMVGYYNEIIEDKKEIGMTEEEAVASLGDIKSLVMLITADIVTTRSNDKQKPLGNAWIILGICASPILLPIGIAFLAVLFSIVVVFLSLLLAFAVSAVAIIVTMIPTAIHLISTGADVAAVLFQIGGFLLASGLLMMLCYLTIQAAKVVMHFTNHVFSRLIKRKSRVLNHESI